MKYWFYAVGNEKKGPISEDELTSLIESRDILARSLVWTKGMDCWIPAEETSFRGFLETESNRANASGSNSPSQPEASLTPVPSIPWVTLRVWQHVLSPTGRIGRLSYLLRQILLLLLVGLSYGAAESLFGKGSDVLEPFSVVIMAFWFYCSFIIVAKRWHDNGQSGWLALLSLVPIVNIVLGLMLLFGRGTEGSNRYGPPYQGL